jgi:predicted dehydrogenase
MVKWGIIGCGGIARRRVVPALSECKNSTVIAVMGVNKTTTDEVASQIGAKAYKTKNWSCYLPGHPMNFSL